MLGLMGTRRVVEALSRDTCLDLLSRAEIGRVVLTSKALPTALPVNYAFDDGDIVFRTGAGAKLAAARAGTVVAFEVDDFEPALRVGWSVIATGIATPVADPEGIERANALNIGTWVETSQAHYVRLRPQMLTGRRISLEQLEPLDQAEAG
jgi:nitroimidazol reductase NimA-like FMN-containing flavoprotein (pyridoxamine 5'-phosphate oxidase superfamily)